MAEPQDQGSPPRWTGDDGTGRSRFAARFLLGLALLGLGALWTLDNLGLADASQITRWWPMLLIVFGVVKVLGWGTRQSTFGGAMWMLAGGWLMLYEFGVVRVGFGGLWPLALIVLGVRYILFPSRTTRFGRRMERGFVQSTDESGRLKMDVVMSNAQRRVEPGPFRGGVVASVLANTQLDLRAATPAEGRVELEVNAVLGGIELFVPHGWQVVSAVTAVLGNVEDHSEKTPAGVAPRGTLYLTGAAVMGSIEIRN